MSAGLRKALTAGGIIVLILLCVCAVFDRELSAMMFKEASRYGGFFVVAGEPAAILLSIFSFNVILAARGGVPAKAALFALAVLNWIYLGLKLSAGFSADFPFGYACAAGLAAQCLCFAAGRIWMKKRHPGALAGEPDPALDGFVLACMRTAAACLLTLFIVAALKGIWGRVRPRDVGEGGSFSWVWIPRFFTGNYSFPSGHTANAACLASLAFFADKKKTRILIWILCAAWIVLVAISRVRGGANFPTDVIAGGTVGIISVAVSPAVVRRHGKRKESTV